MGRNLSGSTWDKQVRDMNFKLAAFGKSRHHADKEHQTHSDALSKKRDKYQKDFINYLSEQKVDESIKLNKYMCTQHISKFLQGRTKHLSKKSAEDYVRGFGGMMKGLQEHRIEIDIDYSILDILVEEIRQRIEQTMQEIHRAIENPREIISELYSMNEGLGLLAQIQYELGFRVEEARQLIQNLPKHLFGKLVRNIIGKGNHMYRVKQITDDLMLKLLNFIGKLPSTQHYNECIKMATNDKSKSSHSWRYNYVSFLYLLGTDIKEISKEINHHREDITYYYLNKI